MVIHCLRSASDVERKHLAHLLRLGPAKTPAQVGEIVDLLHSPRVDRLRARPRPHPHRRSPLVPLGAASQSGARRAGVDGRLLPRTRELALVGRPVRGRGHPMAVGGSRPPTSICRRCPVPGGELVEVIACGLCGSDVEKVRDLDLPAGRVLGHEVVGRLGRPAPETAPGAPDPRPRVALAHHVPCGRCERCRTGHSSLCEQFTATDLRAGRIRRVARRLAAPSGIGHRRPAACGRRRHRHPLRAALVRAARNRHGGGSACRLSAARSEPRRGARETRGRTCSWPGAVRSGCSSWPSCAARRDAGLGERRGPLRRRTALHGARPRRARRWPRRWAPGRSKRAALARASPS